MNCHWCDKKVAAIINEKYPTCREHAIEFQAYCLNNGEPIGIAVKGVSQYLLIPKVEIKEEII